MRIFYFMGFLILINGSLFAQKVDSTKTIVGVEVFENRLDYVNKSNVDIFDSNDLSVRSAENLSQILHDYTNVNIKTYGYGGMSNISMRGGNSYQTAILWDGINIQDPLNGGVNLSLIPIYFLDEVKVQKGGGSALFGSGAMSGAIHLTNNLEYNKGFSGDIYTAYGKFNEYQIGSGIRFSNKNISSEIKTYYKTAKNDFSFQNTTISGEPTQKQVNAEQKQIGLLNENSVLLNSHQKLNFSFFFQKNNQNLPPNMLTASSNEHQYDNLAKGNLQWSYFGKQFVLKIRTTSLYSKIIYSNPDWAIFSTHESFSQISEAELTKKLRKKDQLQIGINNGIELGRSNDILANSKRNRIAIFAAYQSFFGDKASTTISVRKEHINGSFTPLTFSAEANFFNLGAFSINMKASKNYRLPTFNDLYWQDPYSMGNPNLKAESSFGEEASFLFTQKSKNQNIEAELSFFNTNYSNLIQWVPQGYIYTTVNQKKVWARGIEPSFTFSKSFGNWQFRTIEKYSLTLSTLQSVDENNSSAVIGKQSVFSPIHQLNTSFKAVYKNISLEYFQEFVGKRYTTVDNSEFLKSYTTGDIACDFTTYLFRQKAIFQLRWNNIWNTSYQSIPNYAMPKNNYQLTFKVYF